MEARRFAGKVALVTGASSGIGRAAALAFAREGASMVVAARREELLRSVADEIRGAGGRAEPVRCDVGDEAQVEAAVRRAVEAFGRLDCAFNNAGTHGPLLPVHELEPAGWDEAMAVNLRGVWLCMRAEVRAMLAQDPPGGAIVNTSSINGLGGIARASAYAASKAGVLALTKSAAQEYGRVGIRVNALVAGAFETGMLASAILRTTGGDPEVAKAVRAQQEQFIPAGRVGDPREAAEAVLWLCSDAASYVTGLSMVVDGGMASIFH